MTAEQDWADALLVECVVRGCDQAPGRHCVNIANTKTLRDLPHWGRVLAGRVARHAAADAPPPLDVTTVAILAAAETTPDGDTSARLRRVERECEEQRELAKAAVRTLANTGAELSSARQELARLRADTAWTVSRMGGRRCERCEGEIQRGHAYLTQPGTGGLVEHVHCPDPQPTEGAPPE